MPRALITGIGGQDGSYLADILLAKGYEVHGTHRRSSVDNLSRIAHIRDQVTLHRADLADTASLRAALEQASPNEIYHEADQDNVDWSFHTIDYSMDVTIGGVARLLECVRQYNRGIRVFIPSSATIFGNAIPPQTELTPLNPLSPYACGKAAAYHLARYYRQAYDMHVSTAILYNHDSPRRSPEYLLHKVCKYAVMIKRGQAKKLPFSDRAALDLRVDIGYAKDYMQAAHQIVQQHRPDDFIIGAGQACTIREMVAIAFKMAEVNRTPDELIAEDPSLGRPGPQPMLLSDHAKATAQFGFKPATDISSLIYLLMTQALSENKTP